MVMMGEDIPQPLRELKISTDLATHGSNDPTINATLKVGGSLRFLMAEKRPNQNERRLKPDTSSWAHSSCCEMGGQAGLGTRNSTAIYCMSGF